jgi:hypothetical protein
MFQKKPPSYFISYTHSTALKKSIKIYSTLPNSANEYTLASCNIQIL